MPHHEITVIDESDVFVSNVTKLYGWYIIPPDEKHLFEIAKKKGKDEVPKIYRVRLYYRIEWKAVGSGRAEIEVVDTYGKEKKVADVAVSDSNKVAEDEIDITDEFLGPGTCFGLNALRVWLYPSEFWGYGEYAVKVVVKVSWGW